jgi:HEAT repeat protein
MRTTSKRFGPGAIGALILVALLSYGSRCPADRPENSRQEAKEMERLYAEGHEALNDSAYEKAARFFEQAYKLDSAGERAADALYWEAFALQRLGGKKHLREAAEVLELQVSRHRESATYNDAAGLLYRIYGKLAQQGDARSAQRLTELTELVELAEQTELTKQAEYAEQVERASQQSHTDAENMELKLAALQALSNMSTDRSLPLLKKVLANRDPANSELRAQALFLLSQQPAAEAETILLDLVRNDPDPEVRKQAVFWLARVATSRSLEVLVEIARGSEDPEVRERALFALAERGGDRATSILQDLAGSRGTDPEIRKLAIFWLGQDGERDHIAFLKDLYRTVDDPEMKEGILHGIAQSGDQEDAAWLLEIAFGEEQNKDLRAFALHWACREMSCSPAQLRKYYSNSEDRELREMVVFLLGESDQDGALDALIAIAKEETDPELRKVAIFWIGRYEDPRAEKFLLEIINE